MKNALQMGCLLLIAAITWFFASNAAEFGPGVVRPAMIVLVIALFASEALIEKYFK